MLKFKILYGVCFFVLLHLDASAQYFNYGEDPASVKWREISTENFQIIYPESFSEEAVRVANILEISYEEVAYSLDHEPAKISVVIHNNTVVSNGFVAPAPHRMELFSVPPQFNSTTPWLEHLCTHELRHVVQIDKLDQGITKILRYVFGEQAIGAVAGMIPMWFLEGDAVIAESALGHNGRAKLPDFSKALRTNVLDSSRNFGFNKMLMGSYKDYTPNHYSLGYHMAAYTRDKYDTHIWSDVIDNVGKNSYNPFSFNTGVKKHTEMYTGDLYKAAFSFYDSLWRKNLFRLEIENYKRVNNRVSEEYESYRYPISTGSDSVFAIKSDFSNLERFVLVTPDGEEDVYTPGIRTSTDYSYADKKIVWSERVPDVRWEHRSYSVIKVYDLEEKSEYQLTEKSRLFAPAISNKGDKIVSVNVSKDNKYSLFVNRPETGRQMKIFPSLNNMFLQEPAWSPDDKFIYVIALTNEGKTVYRVNYATREWKRLFDPVFENITSVAAGNDYLYFHSTWEDIDNIYAFDYEEEEILRVTTSKYGARDVSSLTDSIIYFSEYSPDGYDIKKLSVKQSQFQKFDGRDEHKDPVLENLKQQENTTIDFDKKKFHHYESTPYKRWENLFNFHSWAPFHFDPPTSYQSDFTVNPGVTFLSQNVLSTAISSLAYSYESGEHKLHSTFTYRGWYPVFSVSANYGGKPDLIRGEDVTWAPRLSNDYMSFDLKVSLPMNLSANKNITRFIPSVNYEYNRDFYYNYRDNYYLRGIKTVDYNIQFQSYRRLAYRDIFPEWGILADVNAKTSPFNEDILGNMLSMQAKFYIPGFFEDHGISFAGGYQKQNPDLYLFSSYLSFPRGYEERYSEKLYSFKSDYVLPLFYPDWSVGPLLYIKRFKADLFYDYGKNQYRESDDEGNVGWISEGFTSYGVELTTDFHFLRTMFPFSAGIRYAYKPEVSDADIEFVFNIDFFSIYKKNFKR
ncbi:MAG: hypothetical protein R6U04_03870 [Bacteroidales bacterium]